MAPAKKSATRATKARKTTKKARLVTPVAKKATAAKTAAPKPPTIGSKLRASRMITRYLLQVRTGPRRNFGIYLGALPGFPAHTRNPEVVQKAILAMEERASVASSPIQELRLRQRIVELRQAAERLDDEELGVNARQHFIDHGRAWAEENGISYEAFRDMHIPASVLKQAGIKPTRKG